MAEINDLIASMTTGIKASQAIATWSADHYGRPCAVFENCDPRDLPGESDCPLVIIGPINKRTGLAMPERPHNIGVACWVYDTQKNGNR